MTEDWAADVRKYVPAADEAAISGIVRHCGIALQNRDSSLVSFTDPAETGRVRESFLKKKLGLTDPDPELDEAIAEVGERMKGDRTKNRVTVYYLLAERFGRLGLFGGADVITPRAPVIEPVRPSLREALREPDAMAGPGAGAGAAAGVMSFSDRTMSAPAPAMRTGLGPLPWIIGAVLLALAALWLLTRRAPEVATAPPAPATPAAPAASVRVATPTLAPVQVPVPAVTAGLPASVHFANASTALSAEDRAAVHAAAEGVRAGGGALALTGYTDNTGSLERNQALAKSRAQTVRAALIADGVPAERIVLTPPASVEVGASADSDPDARRVDIAQRQAP